MIHSNRVRSLLAERGLSQSELARRVGVTQGAIAKVISKNPGGSSHLHKIAHELGTTPAYLTGETDDPNLGAPVHRPEPRLQLITLSVALPSELALARMFAGLLRPFELEREDELSRTLARQLPKALQRLRVPLIEEEGADPDAEAAEALPNDRPSPRRATRT